MSVINHIGVSGGKDSTALLLWAVHESGYPRESIDATFCDTGNEHEWTYEHVAMLSDKVHPITGITPERDFYELAKHKGRFPGAKARFCTQYLKMVPTQFYVWWLESQGHTVVMHSGVRAGESPERAKLPEREPGWLSYFGCETYRPLLRWSFDDVLAIHERYDIPLNPLYSHGCKRVGCLPCCMSRKAEIANIADRFPERIDMIREAEESILSGRASFFPRATTPIRWHDKWITTAKGERMSTVSIDGVVRWARNDSSRYATRFDFSDDTDAPIACDSRYGACE